MVLRMDADSMEQLAMDVPKRISQAQAVGEAIIQSVGRGMSLEHILMGFFRGGKIEVAVTPPYGMDSQELLRVLDGSAWLSRAFPTAVGVSVSYPYVLTPSPTTATTTTAASTSQEAPLSRPAAQRELVPSAANAADSDSVDGATATIVIVCCIIAGVGAAVLFILCVPAASRSRAAAQVPTQAATQEASAPSTRPRSDSGSSHSTPQGIVRYGVSDVNLTG